MHRICSLPEMSLIPRLSLPIHFIGLVSSASAACPPGFPLLLHNRWEKHNYTAPAGRRHIDHCVPTRRAPWERRRYGIFPVGQQIRSYKISIVFLQALLDCILGSHQRNHLQFPAKVLHQFGHGLLHLNFIGLGCSQSYKEKDDLCITGRLSVTDQFISH